MTETNDTCSSRCRRLIEDHLPLVERLAKRVYRRMCGRVELDELISLGTLGLIHAARRYDGRAGTRFATFAGYRIQGAMYDGIGQLGPLPRSTWRRRSDIHVGSLVAEPIDGNGRGADEALDAGRAAARLERALERLPARKRQLIDRCYYGDVSLKEVGRELGVSRSWASRLHAQALDELRREMAALSRSATA